MYGTHSFQPQRLLSSHPSPIHLDTLNHPLWGSSVVAPPHSLPPGRAHIGYVAVGVSVTRLRAVVGVERGWAEPPLHACNTGSLVAVLWNGSWGV